MTDITKRYTIRLYGEASTVFVMELTDEQAELLREVARMSERASNFCGQPTLEITEGEDEE